MKHRQLLLICMYIIMLKYTVSHYSVSLRVIFRPSVKHKGTDCYCCSAIAVVHMLKCTVSHYSLSFCVQGTRWGGGGGGGGGTDSYCCSAMSIC